MCIFPNHSRRTFVILELHLCSSSSEGNISGYEEKRHLTHQTHKREEGFAPCCEKGSPQTSEKTRARLCPLSLLPAQLQQAVQMQGHSVNRLAPAMERSFLLPGFELCFQSFFQRKQPIHLHNSPIPAHLLSFYSHFHLHSLKALFNLSVGFNHM